MFDKLAAVGLIPKRESAKLGPFLATYVSGRSDVKRGSVLNYRQTQDSLLQFFGEGKALRDYLPGRSETLAQAIPKPPEQSGD